MPRTWTEEQKQELRERLARGRAAKAEKAAVEVVEPEEADDVLSQLIAGLQKVQTKKKTTDADLEALGQILDRIDPVEHPEIADNPAIEAFLDKIGAIRLKKAEKQGLPPGSLVGTGVSERDIPWKLSDVSVKPDGTKDMVTWTPNETLPIIYNGVMCQAIADVEMTTERAFYDVYTEHRRLIREAEHRKQWMFGKTNVAPPPDGDGSIAAARARAFIYMSGEGGRGSIINGYPGDAAFGVRELAGGETPTPTPPA